LSSVARAAPIIAETAGQLTTTDKAIRSDLAAVTPLLSNGVAGKVRDAIDKQWAQYLKQFLSATKIAESSPQDAMGIPEQIYGLQLAPMIASLDAVVSAQKKRTAALSTNIDREIASVLGGVLIPLVIAALVVIGFQAFFGSPLKRRLKAMEAEAAALKDGNLARRLPESHDELGQLGAAFNGFVVELNRLLADVQDQVSSTRRNTDQLKARAAAVGAHATEQSNEVAQISTAMSGLSQSVDHVAGFAGDASDSAQDAARLTRDVEARTKQSLTDMRLLQSSVGAASDTLSSLEGAVQRVTAVSELIKEIASQTNLLALNAAIEAARAGEAGRGFAVVADEVRKLSERTAGATGEIGTILSGLSGTMNDARQAMQDADRRAATELEHAEQIAGLTQAAESAVQSVLGKMRNIVDTTVAQSSSGSAIVEELVTINRLVHETSAAMEEMRDTVGDLACGAEQLSASTTRFQLDRH
jgi:methyl-accepting chemotaxis protein